MSLTPYFSSGSSTVNHIGSNIQTDTIELNRYVSNVLYTGTVDGYYYYKEGDSIYRKNHSSAITKSIDLGSLLTDYYVAYFFPIDADSGFIALIGVSETGWDSGDLLIYDIDWELETASYRNAYSYPAVDEEYYYGSIMGVSNFNGSVRVVFGFSDITTRYIKETADFLTYNHGTDTFYFVNGPNETYDNLYITNLSHIYKNISCDLGNGKVAFKLDTNDTPDSPSYLGDSYIIIIDTEDGSINSVALPRNIHDPIQSGDYCYDIYTTYSMATYFQDNSMYILTLYYAFSPTKTTYTRVIRITSDGILSVVNEFDYTSSPDYRLNSLLSSNDKMVSSVYDSAGTTLYFHDVINDIPLFNQTYVSKTVISKTLDEPNNNIITLEFTPVGTVNTEYVGIDIGDWVEEDNVLLYQNGWDWDGWIAESPTVSYETSYIYGYSGATPLSATGIVLNASTGSFVPEDYIEGNLIDSGTIDATINSRVAIQGMTVGKRYMITSTGQFISNNSNPANYIYNTQFTLNYTYPGAGGGWGKEAHDLDAAALNYPSWYPFASYPYARPSADGNHVELFWYPSIGSASCVNIADTFYMGDNEGTLGFEVYEGLTETIELATSVPISGTAVTGKRITQTSSLRTTDVATTIAARRFMRIYFTDSTYVETTSTVYTITSAENGKEFEKVVIGAYFGDSKPVTMDAFAIKIVIKSLVVQTSTDGYKSLKKTTLSGTATEIVNLDSMSELPEFGTTIPFIRLVNDYIIYPYTYNSNSTPYLIHYTGSAGSSISPQIIWWQ